MAKDKHIISEIGSFFSKNEAGMDGLRVGTGCACFGLLVRAHKKRAPPSPSRLLTLNLIL